MSDTESVQSATSNISSHSQNGIEPNFEGFKNDMVQFLQNKEGSYQCNRLIEPSAWLEVHKSRYIPKETYGFTVQPLQKLVEKYKETFYFKGSGHYKWICLKEFRIPNNPESSKTRPVPKPRHRAIDPTEHLEKFVQELLLFNHGLNEIPTKDFIVLKHMLQDIDLSALKTLIAEQ